jgi:DNA polymerase-1
MFLKILEDQKPDFIVVCFDRKAPTFRKGLYAGYQAHRPRMSEDLSPQIKLVHDVLQTAKVEIFEVDGYEADDLIGTISVQAVGGKLDGGIDVYIVSGDRDLLQLVNHNVKMIAPVTGLTNMIVFDENKVFQKYGIKPAQMVDYKALVGDASDNYPGVTGIGPKTASILINEYKSLEGIYKNLEAIKLKNPNLALKLAEGAEAAGLAQKLAGVVLDAPVTLDIEKADIKYFSKEGLIKEFEKFNFKSLLKRLSFEPQLKPIEKPKKTSEQMELL